MAGNLSADALGEVGEATFALLCASAELVCNKSHRDRTGWDFVVEFPMAAPGPTVLLDQRLPLSVSVQVKATVGSGPAKLSLSSADLLAKDLRPSFVVLLRFGPDRVARSGYVIPMFGPALHKVLRRLREAHARGRKDIHKLTISFDPEQFGTRFAPTPEGLEAALRKACGPDRSAYLAEKQRQIEELGYENGRFEGDVRLWIKDADHLSALVLGLEPLPTSDLQVFDRRFGIRLPVTESAFDGLEELRIEPPSVGPCTVAVRGSGLTPAAVFEAEMFAGLPSELEQGSWLLVRHADFTMTLAAGVMNFNSVGVFDEVGRTLAAWLQLVRALAYFATQKGTVVLIPGSDAAARIELPMTSSLDGPYLDQLPIWVELLDGWVRIVEMAGLQASSPFGLKDLWAARRAAFAVALFENRTSRTWFAFTLDQIGETASPVEALYVNSAELGGAAISFAVKITLERTDAGEFRSTRFDALDARPAVADLQDYGDELLAKHGLKIFIHPDSVADATPEETAALTAAQRQP